jgi:hypothetical protein
MLGGLFNQRDKDQTKEVIRDTTSDDELDFLDQEDSRHTDTSQGDSNGHEALDQCEFGPCALFVSVFIVVFIFG